MKFYHLHLLLSCEDPKFEREVKQELIYSLEKYYLDRTELFFGEPFYPNFKRIKRWACSFIRAVKEGRIKAIPADSIEEYIFDLNQRKVIRDFKRFYNRYYKREHGLSA